MLTAGKYSILQNVQKLLTLTQSMIPFMRWQETKLDTEKHSLVCCKNNLNCSTSCLFTCCQSESSLLCHRRSYDSCISGCHLCNIITFRQSSCFKCSGRLTCFHFQGRCHQGNRRFEFGNCNLFSEHFATYFTMTSFLLTCLNTVAATAASFTAVCFAGKWFLHHHRKYIYRFCSPFDVQVA